MRTTTFAEMDAQAAKDAREDDIEDGRVTALVSAPEPAALTMFERLAADPNVPVDKLEKLIELQERIMRHEAKAAFDAAFADMQGEIPLIEEKGQIIVNREVRSKYARLEDILEVVRPILQAHGFALRHRNEFADGQIKIIGILSHRGGHSEQDEFVAKADNSGSKNDIQALGSTRAYGQRYTTLALLGIATKGVDDDGAGSQKRAEVKAPAGFEDWWFDFTACADNGLQALAEAWEKSPRQHREHARKTNQAGLDALKKKASAVGQ